MKLALLQATPTKAQRQTLRRREKTTEEEGWGTCAEGHTPCKQRKKLTGVGRRGGGQQVGEQEK